MTEIATVALLKARIAELEGEVAQSAGTVTDALLDRACREFSLGVSVYPDGEVRAPVYEWFRLDARDAVDFGVLAQPSWHGYSDIRADEYADYVAAVIREPMRIALAAVIGARSA